MFQAQNKNPQISEETRFILSEVEKKFSQLEMIIKSEGRLNTAIPETWQPTEVCTKFGWSRSKFEQFKRDGLFRTFKIGGKVYVYTSDLLALFPKDFHKK
jgi:hypothetical protein